MSALPTISSSTPMSDWFANMNQLYFLVQQQTKVIQNLQERIAVLETQARIIPLQPAPIQEGSGPQQPPKKPRQKREKKTAASDATEAVATVPEGVKKRGRKAAGTQVALSSFLREGEQVLIRIPLGNRQFDEHSATLHEGKLILTTNGQSYDHPTTMVSALAKELEEIGERSKECSKSLNGWTLCTVNRDGKRIPLEKARENTLGSATVEESQEESQEETESVCNSVSESVEESQAEMA